MASYGPVHKLIVYEVGERISRYVVAAEFEDYEIEHPAECKQEARQIIGVDGTVSDPWQEYVCGVAMNIDQAGCRWSLAYSGCLINEPGEYQIQAWSETYRGFDYTEHDGGIGLAGES